MLPQLIRYETEDVAVPLRVTEAPAFEARVADLVPAARGEKVVLYGGRRITGLSSNITIALLPMPSAEMAPVSTATSRSDAGT